MNSRFSRTVMQITNQQFSFTRMHLFVIKKQNYKIIITRVQKQSNVADNYKTTECNTHSASDINGKTVT